MNISSFHLVKIPFLKAVKGLFFSLIRKNTKGLIYSEYMTAMTLGSPILSPSRFLIREIAIFAQWESEKDLGTVFRKRQIWQSIKQRLAHPFRIYARLGEYKRL